LLGLAVDMGSTKLAVYLVELATGVTLARSGVMNPQISFGEDVVSRIAFANKGKTIASFYKPAWSRPLTRARPSCAKQPMSAWSRSWMRWWWKYAPCIISCAVCR